MKCPACSAKLYVRDTMPLDEHTVIRYRVCRSCGWHTTTAESLGKKEVEDAKRNR